MILRHLLSASILTATVAALSATAAAEDLDGGFFILNEDWYGHQNSTINYLRPETLTEYTGITVYSKAAIRARNSDAPPSTASLGADACIS